MGNLRPLYKSITKEHKVRPCKGHAGLWFDKFCNTWEIENSARTTSGKTKVNKLDWIKTLTSRDEGGKVGIRERIKEFSERAAGLVESRRGKNYIFTAESRFVTGLGRSHPVENGFAWHPTLGTPYLSGSSIKGLTRAWAELELGDKKHPDITCFFGDGESSGCICFLDAIPVEPVCLEVDVMTPHYAGWTENDPPGDWRSPTPIHFLVTAAGTKFLFGILPLRGAADSQLNTVSRWLCSALQWPGAGAKTSVGYGRFCKDEEETCKLIERIREEQKRQADMSSPEGRWRLSIEKLSEAELLDLVRINLDKDRLEDPVELLAFTRVMFSVRGEWIKRWRRGAKQDQHTPVGSKKLKERARLLDGIIE